MKKVQKSLPALDVLHFAIKKEENMLRVQQKRITLCI